MTKKKLTVEEANRLATQKGYFFGLGKMLQDYDVSKQVGARIKVMLFKHILQKVLEAKKEIAKLQTSVERLEAACRAGMIPDPATGDQPGSLSVNRLTLEMHAFDGWTISLLESNISLLATVVNPETAGERVMGLQESFANLWKLRHNGQTPFENHPEAFKLTLVNPD